MEKHTSHVKTESHYEFPLGTKLPTHIHKNSTWLALVPHLLHVIRTPSGNSYWHKNSSLTQTLHIWNLTFEYPSNIAQTPNLYSLIVCLFKENSYPIADNVRMCVKKYASIDPTSVGKQFTFPFDRLPSTNTDAAITTKTRKNLVVIRTNSLKHSSSFV